MVTVIFINGISLNTKDIFFVILGLLSHERAISIEIKAHKLANKSPEIIIREKQRKKEIFLFLLSRKTFYSEFSFSY